MKKLTSTGRRGEGAAGAAGGAFWGGVLREVGTACRVGPEAAGLLPEEVGCRLFLLSASLAAASSLSFSDSDE